MPVKLSEKAEDIREILRQEQEHLIDLATALGEDPPDCPATNCWQLTRLTKCRDPPSSQQGVLKFRRAYDPSPSGSLWRRLHFCQCVVDNDDAGTTESLDRFRVITPEGTFEMTKADFL